MYHQLDHIRTIRDDLILRLRDNGVRANLTIQGHNVFVRMRDWKKTPCALSVIRVYFFERTIPYEWMITSQSEIELWIDMHLLQQWEAAATI